MLRDHTSASGVQSQALDTLKDKLADAEERLRHERQSSEKAHSELHSRQSRVESELQHVSEQLAAAQRRLNDEKGE